MEIKEYEVVTQEETGEAAPIDAVEQRVEEEMDELEKEARRSVKEGLGATENPTHKR